MYSIEAYLGCCGTGGDVSAYSGSLQALAHDYRGDWAAAHDLLQEDTSADANWVHAYLHRKEGDLFNAEYWYRRASKPVSTQSLSGEWNAIVRSLLGLPTL